jgi:hypothetical protein
MYDGMPCPGRSIRNVLELFGEIEWGRGGIILQNDDDWKYPPNVVWRYKEKDERRDQLIVDAVESFNGSIEWKISFRDRERLPGRNWWIAPKRYRDFLDELKNNRDIIDATGSLSAEGAFAVVEPEVGETANREIPHLAEHIKTFVQARLSVVQS